MAELNPADQAPAVVDVRDENGTPVIWGDKLFVLSAVPVGVDLANSHQPRGGTRPGSTEKGRGSMASVRSPWPARSPMRWISAM